MTPFALLALLSATPTLAFASPDPVAAEAVQPPSVREVLASAVRASGLHDPEGLELRFVFRGTPYRLWFDGTRAVYVREVRLANGQVRTDRLEGSSLTSTLGGVPLHEVDGVVLIDWANHGRDGQGLSIDQAVRDLEAGSLPQLSTIVRARARKTRASPNPRGSQCAVSRPGGPDRIPL